MSAVRRFPLYAKLLHLYPKSYREQYGDQMLQTLADMLDAAPTTAQRALVWLRTMIDMPLSIGRQQLSFAGHALTQETPLFVRRNTLVSASMFLPFFVIVAINDLTAHGLYHTWLWRVGPLFTWIVLLPAIGMIISTITLVAWLRRMRVAHRSWWRSLIDIRHSWPMLAFVLLGLGILCLVFFHDSVHCVAGNPVRELHNPHATLHCIQQR
ncbi:MAG TPA: hypothetical protein VHT70_03475 [Candidatus Saccharimonadales bacterium]|jgi:hypothetical protein|nr:hypothetical protein [Candidatus Saccharimonadales bacterium]